MSNEKYKQWIALVISGGAKGLFDSHPDDAELAQKMTSMFKGTGVITKEQVSRDRKRFHQRPQRGEIIDEQEASPTKFVIRNKATQLTVEEALAEIVDNVFDNFERNLPKRLDIEIVVYPPIPDSGSSGEILITENSGGIDKKRIVPLIQLGFSERSARGIGAWGEGFKMAVFALGGEVEVFSSFPSEEPVAIHFPKGWLDPSHNLWKKWKVNTYKIQHNPPEVGSTLIRINHVHEAVLNYFCIGSKENGRTSKEQCKHLADYFGEVYAEKYNKLAHEGFPDINITITVGLLSQEVRFKAPVKNRLVQNLAFIPWLRPIQWTATFETQIEDPTKPNKNRDVRLNVEIYAGLAAEFNYSEMYSIQRPGVEMWGNGRLFSLKGLISDSSVGWQYIFGGSGGSNPASNASSRRLTIVALFSSEDSRDVPWAAPVKNDYNRRSEFYAEIQEIFAKVIRLYKNGLRLLESRILPFSHEWITLNDNEKLDILFSDSDATDDFKRQFAESRFGRKVIAYRPDFTFREMRGLDAESTVARVYGISTTTINDTVRAAQETKNSAEKVIELLQAMFPNLHKQAQLEDEMGLRPNEELGL